MLTNENQHGGYRNNHRLQRICEKVFVVPLKGVKKIDFRLADGLPVDKLSELMPLKGFKNFAHW